MTLSSRRRMHAFLCSPCLWSPRPTRRLVWYTGVLLLTALAAPAQSFPGMPDAFPGMPRLDPGIQTPLVSLPGLPPGVAPTFVPIEDHASAPYDPAQALEEAKQRAAELTADLRTVGPVANLPAVGTPAYRKLRAEACAILQRHYRESVAALEPDARAPFAANVTWQPDFSAAERPVSAADQERARRASYPVAYAITHLERPRFVLALAAAIFALDPDSALGAENAASALLASGERRYPAAGDEANLASFRADAEVVYRYALARSVENGKWTLPSLGILINLGNLYVDLGAAERARPVLLAARLFAPDSWDAAVALAACYELQGRPTLARAVLDDPRLSPAAQASAMAQGSKNLSETHEATELSPESEESEFEPILKQFDRQPILTAADFVAQLDQGERNRMRAFVDNLPVKGSYRAPEIDGLTVFSTAKSINQPPGLQALGDFAEKLTSYAMILYARMMHQQEEALARLGLGLQLNVDLQDVFANPHKYQNHKLEGSVTGVDQLRGRLEQMKQQVFQAQAALMSGNVDPLLRMGAAQDPLLAVFLLKPQEFANPFDVLIQQYNASMLGRKLNTYNAYFYAVNERTQKSLTEIYELCAQQMAEIRDQEAAAQAIFDRERAAAAKAGQNTNSPEWRLRQHNLHMRFVPQYNDTVEFAWKRATQVAAHAYERKIAPRAERFYYDVFRHIALISDPAVRARKERDFQQMLHYGVYQGLTHVLMAFGSYEVTQEWDCGCDVGSLLAQAEAERREHDRIAEERRAREQSEKLRFKAGKLPESSPLFKRLDAYGTDLDIPFIPGLKGRISCARTTLELGAEFPGDYSPKINYAFTQDAFSGATTHGGGIEVGVKVKDGSSSISATLNVKGSVAIDGKGKVSDYSVTAASKVKLDLDSASVSAGAEIGYTPTGGLSSDVNAGATISFTNEYGRTIVVGIEASARRGSKLTAKAEQNFNPYSGQWDKEIKESFEPLTELFPVSSSIKKEFWTGTYTL